MDLRFLETAKSEFWEAASYYNDEQEGLGAEFAREVSKALDRIIRYPNSWRPCHRGLDNAEPTDFLMP